MSSRRSRPPRSRKSRNPAAPPQETVVVVMPPDPKPAKVTPSSPLDEELAAVDAGWD
jgi:hypothetical protein